MQKMVAPAPCPERTQSAAKGRFDIKSDCYQTCSYGSSVEWENKELYLLASERAKPGEENPSTNGKKRKEKQVLKHHEFGIQPQRRILSWNEARD